MSSKEQKTKANWMKRRKRKEQEKSTTEHRAKKRRKKMNKRNPRKKWKQIYLEQEKKTKLFRNV